MLKDGTITTVADIVKANPGAHAYPRSTAAATTSRRGPRATAIFEEGEPLSDRGTGSS